MTPVIAPANKQSANTQLGNKQPVNKQPVDKQPSKEIFQPPGNGPSRDADKRLGEAQLTRKVSLTIGLTRGAQSSTRCRTSGAAWRRG